MNARTSKRAETNDVAGPFLKWVGGKRQLLPELLRRAPRKVSGTYFEPFVGGGALFFALAEHKRVTRARLSDVNDELILAYRQVRDNVEGVIRALRSHVNEATHFYEVRSQAPETLTPSARAARVIYLNRCGYNGLYRVNASGKFNVPFGRYTNPTICDAPRLRAASRALQNVELEVEDFAHALASVRKGDFIYCDPPYIPLNATSNFTSYTRTGFDLEDQVRLRDRLRELKSRRVLFLLSNSSAPLTRRLFGRGFRKDEVQARRKVNCRPDGRGSIAELLIS